MDSLLELFVRVDDFCQDFLPFWEGKLIQDGSKKRRRAGKLSVNEIMTILIHFHQSHYRDFKTYYTDYVCQRLRSEFPNLVSYVGIPPGWYGGDLDPVIENPYKGKFDVEVDRIFIEEYQFAYQDVFSDQEYGTIENIVSHYGFIFGKKAIEHIKRENKTTIRWKYRVYWRG